MVSLVLKSFWLITADPHRGRVHFITTHCGANSRSQRYTLWGRGRADHPENPAAFCHRRSHHPVEHLRVALLHTPHTELVKRRPARICHEDFRHARGDTMTHQLIQWVYKFLP